MYLCLLRYKEDQMRARLTLMIDSPLRQFFLYHLNKNWHDYRLQSMCSRYTCINRFLLKVYTLLATYATFKSNSILVLILSG